MSLKADVYNVLNKINSLHIEDPKVYEYWEELTTLLVNDEEETLNFISSLQDEDAIEDISSVFDDVSLVLQSQKFISCIESLKVKYPNLSLEEMVGAAKEAMNEAE